MCQSGNLKFWAGLSLLKVENLLGIITSRVIPCEYPMYAAHQEKVLLAVIIPLKLDINFSISPTGTCLGEITILSKSITSKI